MEETRNYSISENLEIELFENIIKLLLIFTITSNLLLVNLVSLRRNVLLAEFLTNCRNRHGTGEDKKESKMNLQSQFAPP